MRIISGRHRGKKLFTPPKQGVRPTADSIRESLFNILGAAVEDSRFLDVFAGTGAVGLEALSRGAAMAVFIEKDPVMRKILWRNIMLCGYRAESRILPLDYEPALGSLARKQQFAIVYSDPPYGKGLALQSLKFMAFFDLVIDGGLVVLETDKFEESPETIKQFSRESLRRYGDTVLHFFRKSTLGLENNTQEQKETHHAESNENGALLDTTY